MQNRPDTTRGTSSKARQNPLESDLASSLTEGRSATSGASVSVSSFETGASAATNQAKEKLTDAASQAGDKVASRLDTQKDRAAQGLESVAQALRQASDQLRSEPQGPPVHEYVASAANRLEHLSGYLRSTDTKDMIRGLERFARQQPALFVGGAFMVGLLSARFLKTSSESNSYRSGSNQRADSFGRENRRGYHEQQDFSAASRSPQTDDYGHQSKSTSTRAGEDF